MSNSSKNEAIPEDATVFVRATIGQDTYDIGLAPTIAQLRERPENLKVIGPAFLRLVEHVTGIVAPVDTTNFQDVGEFQEKYGLDNVTHLGTGPRPEDAELMAFRVKFMREELDEFIEGLEEGDEAKMADALVDLVYVVLGTAHFRGYPWQQLWDDVQAANMRKVRAQSDGSDSKRGSSFDVVKPEGWVGPNTHEILRKHGFNV